MPSSCAVATCANSHAKTKNRGIIYHGFPLSNAFISNQWVAKCKRKDKFKIENSRICSEHFTSSDYVDDMRNRLLGLPERKILKESSVPSLNLSCDMSDGSNEPSDILLEIRQRYFQNNALAHIRLKAVEMPVLHPAESDSVMEVDVASTSTNHSSILNKQNGIEDSHSHIPNGGVIDSNSNKQNGIADSMSTFKSSSVPQPSQFDGIFRNCKTLVLIKEREDDNLRKIVDATAEIRNIWDRSEFLKKKIRNVIDTKGFMFTTPLNSIKVHPQFQKFTALFCNGVANGTSAPSAVDGLEVVKVLSRTKANLPPAGHIKRKDLQPGEEVYVMKTNSVDVFVEGTVLSVRDTDPEKLFKVRFEETKSIPPKLYTAKQLAYKETPTVIVPVGTRIIARYSDGIKPSLYAGIVAEPPKLTNQERYLIFFDDGYAQYIEHKDIYVVCAQSIDVADDVHENISEFIRAYLQKYPERPMVKLQKDQITKTEYDRKWWDTKVLDVDASMVKMYFIASHRTEWIYRGSTRLKLLYNELANAEASRMAGKHRRHNIVPRKPNHPYVEYTRELRDPSSGNVETIELDSDSADESKSKPAGHQHPRRKTGGSQYLNNADKPRNTARKSTTQKPGTTEGTGAVERYHTPDIKSHLGYKDLHNLMHFTRVKYGIHTCGPQCHEKEDPIRFKGKNPFLIPIYLGWERQLRKYTKSGVKTQVMYRTPCGRHLRDLQEIQNYLFLVNSRLTIDFFTMDSYVVIFRTFRPREALYKSPDVTQGKENVPVCCVNSWDTQPPPFVEYAAKRFPGQGVFLNEDKEFLCGCSCTDNCQDSAKCECQQITNYAYSGRYVGDVGYKFRRLKEPVVTGIFECNDRCKCGPQCGNRVVQNGLQVRLQMFKTQSKGWGIRCLDDLDAGMFICIYAGQLLTEQGADEDGNQFGDEYLAELDHIEVAEKCKEGYETDVSSIEDMEVEESKEEKQQDDDYDDKSEDSSVNTSDSEVNICETDSDFESSIRSTAVPSYATRSRRKSHIKNSDTSSNASVSSFGTNEDSNNANNKKFSNKELPDITSSLDSFTLVPRPLSPASAEIVEKTELKRIPKISEDGVKSVAKKSLSMKHPGATGLAIPVVRQKGGYRSIRSYYGEDSLYIMDAKSKGNIGRYLNHSCAPNVFVQNVFVETHDLRFPEVAFFAQNFIQAGTELTWDYNYEVGSVADKVMYCYCDARTCRGRLL